MLADPSRRLAPIVEALDVLVGRLATVRYALIGGLAVFAHIDVHRATSDIDAALATTEVRTNELVAEIGERVPGRQPSFSLPNDVVFDVLLSDPAGRPPRRGIGHRREARGLAVAWAIDTAEEMTLALEPPAGCGDVTVKVARIPALIALKLVALDDPDRPDAKRESDLHDLWSLLTARITETPAQLRAIAEEAPTRVAEWVPGQLERILSERAYHVVRRLTGVTNGPTGADEVVDLWQRVVSPALERQSRDGDDSA